MMQFEHKGPEQLRIAVLAADGIDAHAELIDLDLKLEALLEDRSVDLSPELDAWRQAVRDIFRNGTYKPTGRAKPASEYLLRAAREGTFPRINALVDINNYISLYSLLPASLWDVDRANAEKYVIRLGLEGESYVFNASGQSIDLKDLIVGCAVDEASPNGRPIVNAVKDCMSTKTTDSTTRMAAIIYARMDDGPAGSLDVICERFETLLSACGSHTVARSAILLPGQSAHI